MTAPDARQSDELREAREALAHWLAVGYQGEEYAETQTFSVDVGGHWIQVADEVLALPELTAWAEKLARERAAEELDLRARVEAVAEEWEREANADAVPGKSTRDQVRAGTLLTAAARLRAAAL